MSYPVKPEPAPLDRFIGELRALSAGTREEAYLEAVQQLHAAQSVARRR